LPARAHVLGTLAATGRTGSRSSRVPAALKSLAQPMTSGQQADRSARIASAARRLVSIRAMLAPSRWVIDAASAPTRSRAAGRFEPSRDTRARLCRPQRRLGRIYVHDQPSGPCLTGRRRPCVSQVSDMSLLHPGSSSAATLAVWDGDLPQPIAGEALGAFVSPLVACWVPRFRALRCPFDFALACPLPE